MKLSVIVPAYNREQYIGSALRSLLRQRDEADIDIVVVDDGSTDGTVHLVRELMRDNPSIRLFSQAHMGVAAARNTGLRHVLPETELISFLDSDDISPPGRFNTDLRYFYSDRSVELTYSWLLQADAFDEETLEPAAGCDQKIYRGVQLGAGIFRRQFIEAIKGFDTGFVQSEDTDFLFRVFERNPRYILPETISVYYRKHRDSLTARLTEMRREFMRACHKSMMRRKADPSLGFMPDLIQMDPSMRGKV